MRNINFIKISKLVFLFSAIVLLLNCTKEENPNNNKGSLLVGIWTDTIIAQPKGYYIDELKINEDFTFSLKSQSCGIYTEQSNDEISGWFEFTGNYSQNDNKLYLTAHKNISWDSFYGGQPITVVKDQQMFENCTYTIVNEILELNYITYPADAPVGTIKRYKKSN